jgi:hypothetical protein
VIVVFWVWCRVSWYKGTGVPEEPSDSILTVSPKRSYFSSRRRSIWERRTLLSIIHRFGFIWNVPETGFCILLVERTQLGSIDRASPDLRTRPPCSSSGSSYIATDGQSARSSWCLAPFGHTGTEVEVTLRPTVSRPVSLGVRRPSGTSDQFFALLEIFF